MMNPELLLAASSTLVSVAALAAAIIARRETKRTARLLSMLGDAHFQLVNAVDAIARCGDITMEIAKSAHLLAEYNSPSKTVH